MAFWENRYTLPSNPESNYCKAAATLTGLLTFAYSYFRKVISHAWTSDDDVMVTIALGRLAFKRGSRKRTGLCYTQCP